MPDVTPYSALRYRKEALTPEIVDPRLADVEALARWLDYSFTLPGGFQFGFAGIIGLIPGIGDVFDAIISFYIVVLAIQLGVPRVALVRMVVNVGIEGVAGSIPFFGDLFVVGYKANRRNYQLLLRHLTHPSRRNRAQDWIFLLLTLLVAAASVALPVFALIELAKHL